MNFHGQDVRDLIKALQETIKTETYRNLQKTAQATTTHQPNHQHTNLPTNQPPNTPNPRHTLAEDVDEFSLHAASILLTYTLTRLAQNSARLNDTKRHKTKAL
jgi:hypothetical protein